MHGSAFQHNLMLLPLHWNWACRVCIFNAHKNDKSQNVIACGTFPGAAPAGAVHVSKSVWLSLRHHPVNAIAWGSLGLGPWCSMNFEPSLSLCTSSWTSSYAWCCWRTSIYKDPFFLPTKFINLTIPDQQCANASHQVSQKPLTMHKYCHCDALQEKFMLPLPH